MRKGDGMFDRYDAWLPVEAHQAFGVALGVIFTSWFAGVPSEIIGPIRIVCTALTCLYFVGAMLFYASRWKG